MRSRNAAAAIAALVVSACTTVGPDFVRPAAPTATGYAMAGDSDVALTPSANAPAQWWRAFGSDDLNAAVELALARSASLAAADAALARARFAASAARGGTGLSADYDASGNRERVNTAAFGIDGFPSPTINLYSIGTSASFDLDLFGGGRRRIESTSARAEAQARRTDAAYLTLSGAVVTKAIEIASLDAQIAALIAIVEDDQRTLDLVTRAVEEGGAPRLAQVTATAQLAEDQARLPPLRLQLAQARHALGLLSGQAPGTWAPPAFDLAAIAPPADIPVVLPSALVRRRPDILAAEADLHAATADIGVATAALYPTLSLGAAFSLAALQPETVFNYESSGWSVGPSVTGPLFHNGALRANRGGAQAARDEAMARYQLTVLTAFTQVSDLLEALTQDRALIAAQTRAADAATENARLARVAYENGAGTLLSVVDAQRQAQRATLGLIDAQARLRRDAAALFVATAADWRGGGAT